MQRIEKLIFEQAEHTPEAVAVEHNGARLSYAELKQQSLEIGYGLRQSGLNAGETVGIFQHRSLMTLPLMLGIWEAGGIVVPINPTMPAKMLERLIQDSAPKIIVADGALKPHMINAVQNLDLRSTPTILAENRRSNGHSRHSSVADFIPSIDVNAFIDPPVYRDDCYVIYTSGSEGRPKGVRGSHEALLQYLRWQATEFSVTEADRFSQTAPLSFDFSLKELLVPLVCGARVCIADRPTVMDPRKFVEWVRESGITLMSCVPTLLRSILQLPPSPADADVFKSLRSVLISGDMLRWDDVAAWRERFGTSMSLFNLYGPTESTVIKLFYPIPETRLAESSNVPVGRPITDADVLIVDDDGEPCASGEIGEIVILSEWIARGYLNGDNRSFCRLYYQGEDKRAYHTGDLGKLLGNGVIELVGRKDRQVKIRGYRIELDEIESVLSEHAGIGDVAVVAPVNGSGRADDLAVIACYFTTENPRLSEKEIKAFAQQRLLPPVMSLIQFRRLEKLPTTVNGKVDRLKLESMIEVTGKPATPTGSLTVQQRVSAIWEELLAVNSIDPQANFFELGGDSMTAIRLLRRLREEVGAEVKLGDVYEFPSIVQLSNRVEQLLA